MNAFDQSNRAVAEQRAATVADDEASGVTVREERGWEMNRGV